MEIAGDCEDSPLQAWLLLSQQPEEVSGCVALIEY